MIPKTIHWCWFGRGEKSELIHKCVESWKKYCPDYQIVEWNEDNFDIECNPFVKEAYESRKFAFVADYARLYVLYHYGGIYLDSDVEVVKPLDESFLEHQGFSGFETPKNVPTGIMASEKGFELMKCFLDYYEGKHFVNEDGSFNDVTNVAIITDELEKRGLKRDNTFQVIDGFALYPRDYFCPLEDYSGYMYSSENTYTIHWFSKSWWKEADVKKYKRTKFVVQTLGKDLFVKLLAIKHKLFPME